MHARRSVRRTSILLVSVAVLTVLASVVFKSTRDPFNYSLVSRGCFVPSPRFSGCLRARRAVAAVSTAEGEAVVQTADVAAEGEAVVQTADVTAEGEAVVQTADVTAEGEAIVQTADVTERQKSDVFFDNLFPVILVKESSFRELGKQIRDTFRGNRFGIVDLVLTRKESRGKLLWALAQLPADWGAWATFAPRRRDRRMRMRIALGQHAAKEPAEVMRVSNRTEPSKLARAISAKLFDLERKQRSGAGAGGGGGLQIWPVGADARAIAALAIEEARFRSKRDIRIMAAIDTDATPQLLSVTVVLGRSAAAPGLAQHAAAEMESAADPDSADAAPVELRWSPPTFANLFPTLLLTDQSSSMGAAKAVAEHLESHTTRIVDLTALGASALPRVVSLIAALPDFFDVAAQVGPDNQYTIIKKYPLLLPPEVSTARVAALTDPEKLSAYMRAQFQSHEEQRLTGAVRFELSGPDASKALLRAFQVYQAETKRELTFKVAKGTDSQRGVVVTAVAS